MIWRLWVQTPLGAIFDEIYFVLLNLRSVRKSDRNAWKTQLWPDRRHLQSPNLMKCNCSVLEFHKTPVLVLSGEGTTVLVLSEGEGGIPVLVLSGRGSPGRGPDWGTAPFLLAGSGTGLLTGPVTGLGHQLLRLPPFPLPPLQKRTWYQRSGGITSPIRPPPRREQPHTCENITSHHTTYAGGSNVSCCATTHYICWFWGAAYTLGINIMLHSFSDGWRDNLSVKTKEYQVWFGEMGCCSSHRTKTFV